MMLREQSWRKARVSRPTCWKVEKPSHSLLDEIRKT